MQIANAAFFCSYCYVACADCYVCEVINRKGMYMYGFVLHFHLHLVPPPSRYDYINDVNIQTVKCKRTRNAWQNVHAPAPSGWCVPGFYCFMKVTSQCMSLGSLTHCSTALYMMAQWNSYNTIYCKTSCTWCFRGVFGDIKRLHCNISNEYACGISEWPWYILWI